MGIRMRILMGLLAFWVLEATAQNDVQFSDYTRLRSYYNPAVSGTDGMLNVSGAYSMQFAGYDNAPATMLVGADLPIYFLSARHGAGVNLLSDKFGMFNTQRLNLQYSYNIRLGAHLRLAFGGSVAMLMEKMDPSGVKLEDQSDPAFPTTEVNGQHVDFGAGVYLYHPRYFVSASCQHLAAPRVIAGEKYYYDFDRMYYLMGGCNIPLKNTFITLQPSFLVTSDLNEWREDVQCKVEYNHEGRSFYAGVGYSPDISTTFMLGGNFHGVCLGYSYQLYTSGIGMINGSHELTVGYLTDLDLFKKGRNRHKSVRFL